MINTPRGRFELDDALYKYWGRSGRFAGLSLVYALEPLAADGCERSEGEVFQGGTLDVETLLAQRKVRPVPSGAQFDIHVPTKRVFLGSAARDAYASQSVIDSAQKSLARADEFWRKQDEFDTLLDAWIDPDVTRMVTDPLAAFRALAAQGSMYTPPQPATTALPGSEGQEPPPSSAAPRTRPGRPRRFESAQDLHDELVAIGKTLPPSSCYLRKDYADAMGISLQALDSHLKFWRKQAPEGLLAWSRIVSDTKAKTPP